MEQPNTHAENPALKEIIESNNDLKDILIQYVGNKLNPKDKNVTVEMAIEVLAEDFPELVMSLAEENWVRGYQQGLDDVHVGKKLMEEENGSKKSCKLCEGEK
jgi:hypothetical protein